MVTKKKVTKKLNAKAARPARGASRAEERPARKRSLGNHRDMLSVEHMDPEFSYRWILGATENDKRVFYARQDGWEFVDAIAESGLVVGDFAVGKSESLGSVYRIPASRRGNEEYLYLMRMPADLFESRNAEMQAEIDDQEKELTRKRYADEDEETGQYGQTALNDPRRRGVSL